MTSATEVCVVFLSNIFISYVRSVYSDWDSSAKDDHGKGRDCVVLDSDEGKWRDDSCSQKYSFLCKKNADGK